VARAAGEGDVARFADTDATIGRAADGDSQTESKANSYGGRQGF